MPNLPSGTVTFLFTDIEGSTKRWEKYPRQMQAAVERHDDLLRHAIGAKGGYVFKTVGDAFCAAFTTPGDALSAALNAQHALQRETWAKQVRSIRVRMALHTGIAQERDGDYFGQPVNRVARLLSAGHGGQVLLSIATYELLRDQLPDGVALLDFGERRLKDLIRPERVFQVVAPDLPSEFPPIKTLDARPNNLPVQSTPLVGREKEIGSMLNLLADEEVHLVTLTGPGGVGKTRLALQVAADVIDEFEDGVIFVALAPIVEPRLVLSTIAQAMGVKETAGQPLMGTLKEHLRDKQMLLLLDNFEQVVEAAPFISELIAASPKLKVLVTSRETLHLRGEHEFPVPPLALPAGAQLRMPLPLERFTQYEAVRLFIERALAVKPDFAVTNDNAPAVAEICVRLDGLPLAIELAAARVKVLPPKAMLSRLESRLKLLTGGARDLPARQQTLRSAIEWSYDLLTDGEKQLFGRLAVFQGGRALEAIEVVCNSDGNLQIDVLDGVSSLLDKSLMYQVEGVGAEPRYWLLETIHEYAREKLQESGEEDQLRREHALYFTKMAEEAEPELRSERQGEWLARLEDEHANMRAALLWARTAQPEFVERTTGGESEPSPTQIGLRLAGALWRFWNVHGYMSEGREQLAAALAMNGKAEQDGQDGLAGDAYKRARTKVVAAAGNLAYLQGDYSAARLLCEESLAAYRELGDKQGTALALNNLGNIAIDQGDYAAARALNEESLAIKRELGDKRGIANSLNNLGNVARNQGEHERARALHEESLALKRELGDKRGIASSLNNLGAVAYRQGDYAGARALHEESLAIRREIGHRWGIALALNNLADVARMQGDYPAARSLYEESLVMRRELGDKRGIAYSLNNLGLVASSEGDFASASLLCRESLTMRRQLEDRRGIAEGLGSLATYANMQGMAGRAVRLWAAAETLREAISAPLAPADLADHERNLGHARAQLGEEAFEKARAEGRAMSMDEAIDYALAEKADDNKQ